MSQGTKNFLGYVLIGVIGVSTGIIGTQVFIEYIDTGSNNPPVIDGYNLLPFEITIRE
ncbi:MAG: hypothetical protein GY870_19975 [archaeon]|nr:hypothetical protein [archaeon]